MSIKLSIIINRWNYFYCNIILKCSKNNKYRRGLWQKRKRCHKSSACTMLPELILAQSFID